MKTETIYLLDPYKKNISAKVLDVVYEANESRVILDKTVFYPMGGGQPTDQGIFKLTDGTEVEVYQVQIREGEIWHSVKSQAIKAGQTVEAGINWDRRFKNMRMHSAGHIIDCSLVELGFVPKKLSPQKADHGKKPYIIYNIKEDPIDLDKLKPELEAEADKLIKDNLEFTWGLVSYDELAKEAVYLQPNLPTNKPLRMLKLEGVGAFADGGTIVHKTSEVGSITIENIEKDGGSIKINYSIGDSAASPKVKESKNIQPSKLPDNLKILLDEAEESIKKIQKEDELTVLWRKYLGKEGLVTELTKKIKNVPTEERKEYGQNVNKLKIEIDAKVNLAKENLKHGKNDDYLNTPQGELKLNKPKIGHLHPLSQTILDLNDIFRRIGFSVMDGPELETDEYCFQRLNLPLDHPARDLQDSIFVEEPNILLRTQTSSIEAHAIENIKPPFKVVMPGRVYRNEKVNRTNHFTFHQYQMTAVKQQVSMAELFAIINYMFKTFLGDDVEIRFRCKYYPEVEPGVGPDLRCFNCHGDGCPICKYRGWIEMGGAGIIHPNVLKMGGLDPKQWQGYAFGMGLDRWAMAKHKITDIRTLLGGNLAYKSNE